MSWQLKQLCIRQFARIVKYAVRMFTFTTHYEENKVTQQQNWFCHWLALILQVVNISSRVISISPGPKTLSLIWDLFFLCVLQGNSARGCIGYMIKLHILLQDRISAIVHQISLKGSRIKTRLSIQTIKRTCHCKDFKRNVLSLGGVQVITHRK